MSAVAIVTGAASGIGKSVVEKLIKEGYFIFAIDRQVQPPADTSRVLHYTLDLRTPHSVLELFQLVDKSDRVATLLVNCAGIREIEPVVDLSFDQWSDVLWTNLTLPFLLSQEFCRRRVKLGGAGNIVNVASVSGVMAEPHRAAYVSSKHGLIGLTKQLAWEFGACGIRVNAVSPGVVETPLTQSYFHDPELAKLIRSNHALERWAQPEEVANAIVFLASEKANFITGTNLVVDGGWTAGKKL